MLDLRLYLLQRLSALIMIPLALGHVALMLVVEKNGLSASAILARTQGSVFWAGYYGLFVLAVSVHGAIGVRAILAEWAGLRGRALAALTWAVAAVLLLLGGRAVWLVTAA